MDLDLVRLQSLIHKSAESYYAEFSQQMRHFHAQIELFTTRPESKLDREFATLVNFLTSVVHHYKKEQKEFSQALMSLLKEHGQQLTSELRMNLAKSLIRMRSRKIVSAAILLPLFFQLFAIHDKTLRSLLFAHIVGDIRRNKNASLNKQLQNFMFTMLKDESEIAQKKSLEVCCALWNKKVWRDAKTVNVIAAASLSDGKAMVPALRFFIDPEQATPEDEEDARRKEKPKKSLHQRFSQHSKMTRGKKRRMLKAEKEEKNEQRRKMDDNLESEASFPALELMYDPQKYAESLFAKLRKSNAKFEVRVLMMRVISKVIKRHSLQLLDYYSFLQRYLAPHQQHVTVLLVCLIEACHELVPPDALQPLVRQIQRDFCSEYRSGPIIQLGINSLREIAMRSPLALDKEVVRDIVHFKGYQRDKGVVMAARSLINLYRVINPNALHSRDRGKEAQMEREHRQPLQFGEVEVIDAEDVASAGSSDEYDSEDSEENPLKRARRDLEEDDIAGYRSKLTKEEKLAVVEANKLDKARPWHDRWEVKTSSTNVQKRRQKPFMLTKHSALMRKKSRMSLSDIQKRAQQRKLKAAGKRFFKHAL